MSRRRLLSVCRGVPAWGDANPWAYALHAVLAASGFEPLLVNLLSDAESVYFRYLLGERCEDPDRLGGVRRGRLDETADRGRAALAEIIDAFAPEVAVAWEPDTARALRQASAELPLVLVGTRCARLDDLIAAGAVRDYLDFRSAIDRGVVFPVGRDDPELAALQACDLMILPSALARTAYEHLFAAHAGKMYARAISPAEPLTAEAERCLDRRRPFAERDIDVAFVAGRWDVEACGLSLVERLCARLPGRRIVLAGECGAPSRATRLGVLARDALLAVLGRSKVVVAPAFADPSAGSLFAAAAMGCNVVASPNCGPWELCAEALRVAAPSPDAFLARIDRALVEPIPDHRQRFLDGGTADLVETLAAL